MPGIPFNFSFNYLILLCIHFEKHWLMVLWISCDLLLYFLLYSSLLKITTGSEEEAIEPNLCTPDCQVSLKHDKVLMIFSSQAAAGMACS